MKQKVLSNTYPDWPDFEVEFPVPIELFIDNFQGYELNKKSFKILYVKEMEAISGFKKSVIENQNMFDAIITYDEDILRSCKKSHFLEFGTTWVFNYNFPPKKFQVSHLTGHKLMTEGHWMRQKVHYKQNKIKIPKDFFISKYGGVENFNNNKILGEKKDPLFDSQFHICIENSKQKNCFTEKLIDCFTTKTIPIYWGCPNIDEFFDINGLIIVENIDDIFIFCNSLHENYYYEKIEYIEKKF